MSDKPAIAFVAAHPDDIAMVGGTLAMLKDRCRIHDLCLTRGQRGHAPADGRDTGEVRIAEEAASCELLGAKLHSLDQMDGELFAGREICERVAGIFREIEPAAVFALWPIEVPDHAAAHTIAMHALRLTGLYYETEIYLCEMGHGGQTNVFHPDIYVDITPALDLKRRIADCHASQWGDRGGDMALEQARWRGRAARVDYAEPFKFVLPLINRRWGRRPEVGRLLLDL